MVAVVSHLFLPQLLFFIFSPHLKLCTRVFGILVHFFLTGSIQLDARFCIPHAQGIYIFEACWASKPLQNSCLQELYAAVCELFPLIVIVSYSVIHLMISHGTDTV